MKRTSCAHGFHVCGRAIHAQQRNPTRFFRFVRDRHRSDAGRVPSLGSPRLVPRTLVHPSRTRSFTV